MEMFPALRLGWLNGWILVAILYLTYIIILIIFPKDVINRLYDKSGRSKRHKLIIYTGSFFAGAYFTLIILSPLKIGAPVFIPGVVVFLLGMTGFVVALHDFKVAPGNQPITSGLYRISRHPQQLMLFVALIGTCIAIGSWTALILQLLLMMFLHTRLLAEEEACLSRYGEAYRAYMQRVPRYFLFF